MACSSRGSQVQVLASWIRITGWMPVSEVKDPSLGLSLKCFIRMHGLGGGPLCRKPNSKILPPYRRAVLLKPVVGKGRLLTMLGVKWTKIEIKNVSGHFATLKRMVLYLEEHWIFNLWNIVNRLLLRTQVSMPAVNSFMSEVKCFTFYRRGQKQDGCHTTVLCRWWKYTVLCSEANSYW